MGLIIRAAQMDDAPAMGRLAVATFLAAHRGHIPEEVWAKRRDEWSAEDSARNWARTLRAIADGTNPCECVYLAVDETCDEVIGIAMGQPAYEEPWPNTGAIKVLYVLQIVYGWADTETLIAAAGLDPNASGKAMHLPDCTILASALRSQGETVTGQSPTDRGPPW